MWPFTRRAPLEPARDLAERVDDLEDTSRHLERRFVRLQQQFTRWARELDDVLDPDPEPEDDADEVLREIVRSKLPRNG